MVELIALASEPELRNRLRADLRWLRRNLTAGTPRLPATRCFQEAIHRFCVSLTKVKIIFTILLKMLSS